MQHGVLVMWSWPPSRLANYYIAVAKSSQSKNNPSEHFDARRSRVKGPWMDVIGMWQRTNSKLPPSSQPAESKYHWPRIMVSHELC